MITAPTGAVVAQQAATNDVLSIALALLALGIGLAALLVLCDAVFSSLVARARQNAEHMPFRSFAVGLINFIFFGLIAIAFLSGDETARLIGLVIATILLSFAAVGLAVAARWVGERLRPDDPSTTRRLLAGAVTLELAALVPLVGWFAVPALAGLIGYGATIIALVRRPTNDDRPTTSDE